MKTYRQPNWFNKVIVDFKKLTEMYTDMGCNPNPVLKSLDYELVIKMNYKSKQTIKKKKNP